MQDNLTDRQTDRQTNRQTDRQTGYPSIDKPWLKYYSKEALLASLPECTVYNYLYINNKDHLTDTAIEYMGSKISYGDLFANIDLTATAFLKVGVKEKDIVTVALPSIPEAIYCVYALNKIGAVANMIHPLAGKDETVNHINEVSSKVVVIFDGAYQSIIEGISETEVKKVIVASPADSLPFMLKALYRLKVKKLSLDGTTFISWKSFIKAGKGTITNTIKRDIHDMTLISHTGGTTGEPKGVMCSDYGLNALMYQIVCNFEYDRNGVSLIVLPPFVNYCLVEGIMAMLAIGYKVVLIPKYEPDKFADYVNKYHPTVVLSIPGYWEAMLEKGEMADMSCFEHIYYGGEGMSDEMERDINDFIKKCGSKTPLCKGLGSTELMAAATQSYPDCNPIGSVGIPHVKVICKVENPETGEELGYGKEGELCFTGPTLMMGYYNNQNATDEMIRMGSDGKKWLHTGDIGYVDENGIVYVTGRIKRIIMTKDEKGMVTKIFPDRIEKAVCVCDKVEVCCVIGIPDKDRINYAKAFVTLKGNQDRERIEDEILETIRPLLPLYMIPEEIEIIDEMPRTPRGKIDYRELESKKI